MTAASPTSSERMIEPELLITGEAVALEITPATVANRITSGLIDYAVYALGAGLSVVVVMVLAISSGSEFRENLALTGRCCPWSSSPGWSSSPCSSSFSAGAGAWAAW